MSRSECSVGVSTLSEAPDRLRPRDVVQRFYALLEAGDGPAALTLLAPDVEWLEAERSPYYSGVLHGVEAVMINVLQPITRDFSDFIATPKDFIAEGDRVAAFGLYTGIARNSGRSLSAPFVHLWTVADSRLRHFVQHTDASAWAIAIGAV